MKLTSLNLEGFNTWEDREKNILSYLQQEDSDIIVFQEVVFIPQVSAFNQVQILNGKLGYPYEHSSISRLQVGLEYEVYREGLSVLSKYPVVKTDVIILKKEPLDEHNRIIQLVDVFINDKLVKIANIQFSLTDDIDFATAHLKETLEILSSRGETRIIAGDFNINHLENFEYLWGRDYYSSTIVPYVSYPSMDKRNDYVLIPKEYEFGEINVSGDGLSDHRGLTAQIRL